MKKCHACKAEIAIEKISFHDECRKCGSDLHVCLNCLFYDTGKANACREDSADYVRERDKANYCEYFRLNDKEQDGSVKEKAEELWKGLFKK